nr:alpha/beta fold hydrolase [Corynebacterium provencense]
MARCSTCFPVLLSTLLSTVLLVSCGYGGVSGSGSSSGAAGAPESAGAAGSTGSSVPGDPSGVGPRPTAEVFSEAVVSTELPAGESRDSGFTEHVVYPVRGGVADPSQNWADFYLPPGRHDEDSVPLVVFIHGGAWRSGATGARRIARDLTSRGVAVLNVEYRAVDRGGGWPVTFSDVADALDYVPELDRRHPEITVDDETVVGHSAGAQLAAWAGTRGDLEKGEIGADPRFTPTRVVSLSGPLDMRWSAEHGDDNVVRVLGGSPSQVPDRYAAVDPIQNINPRIPVVAVHGTDDSVVPVDDSRRYVSRLSAEGGRAKLVLLTGEDHVSYLKRSSPRYDRVLDIIHGVSTLSPEDLGRRLNGGTAHVAQGSASVTASPGA